jgi:hypothetical protein
MTETPQGTPNPDPNALSEQEVEKLVRSLRRKEGSWVDWGKACHQLARAGYNSQNIFEETGFEPVHQNQVIVGSQVYDSIVNVGVSENTRSHFARKGSDILYELRILTQEERAAAAESIVQRNLDFDESHELVKAMKDFSRLSKLPEGFSSHPGDAVAYQSWKLARQKSDMQERSRLIARGLSFAHTPSARQKIEQLLTDFTVTPSKPAPMLPVYRIESAEQLPRILPVVGEMPLTPEDLQAVPLVEEEEPFGMVKASGNAAWVPIPSWQVVLRAEDPVAILCHSDRLPQPLTGKPESVLLVVDRSMRVWDENSYFICDRNGTLDMQWFESQPDTRLLGKILLVLRPKKILDEEYGKEVWQIDE